MGVGLWALPVNPWFRRAEDGAGARRNSLRRSVQRKIARFSVLVGAIAAVATLSAWENESALQAFVHAAPHVESMRALIPHMGATRFVRWTVRGADLPVRWDEALRR